MIYTQKNDKLPNFIIKIKLNIFLILIIFFTINSCDIPLNGKQDVVTPVFNEDSSFNYIAKQVDFGPRVPNTKAHDDCAVFLEKKLQGFGAEVIVQSGVVTKYNGTKLEIKNIIAQFYPEKKDRILLFSHWDSRFIADQCTDTSMTQKPIAGANDGGSGVGVLLEIARNIGISQPNVGVDIIFFDAEDQGEPVALNIMNEKSWCLGTQYWCDNLHEKNYSAKYGISLDMVGGKNAKFSREDHSRHFAGYLERNIWELADSLGYANYFINEPQKGVLHDHVFVSQNAGIRSILIVEYHKGNTKGFGDFWHTHNDNINIIDKKTLKAVGQTVLATIYRE